MRLVAFVLASTLLTAPLAAQATAGPAYGAFGFDTAGMDAGVKPGASFYDYANGTWQKNTAIPADRPSYGMFNTLQDLSLTRTRAILDEASAKPGSAIGDFYASFMDEAAADAKGIAPVKPWLAAIAGAADKRALAREMATLQRQGVENPFYTPGPFEEPVSPDDKNPRVNIYHLHQGGLALPTAIIT